VVRQRARRSRSSTCASFNSRLYFSANFINFRHRTDSSSFARSTSDLSESCSSIATIFFLNSSRCTSWHRNTNTVLINSRTVHIEIEMLVTWQKVVWAPIFYNGQKFSLAVGKYLWTSGRQCLSLSLCTMKNSCAQYPHLLAFLRSIGRASYAALGQVPPQLLTINVF